jgi:SAM-dependent methyltransferase
MSFSAEWLALREPADHRARDPGLADALAAHLRGRERVSVVDLGCGAGSNLRALAPRLGPVQAWRLVDYDPALLEAARARLAAWADAAEPRAGGLDLRRGGQRIAVAFHPADLVDALDGALGEAPDLVTAAALFDLGSVAWIEAVAEAVAARGAAFYTVLSYDGTEEWTPPHPADGAVRDAFHAHQGRDKGFGPAAGPDATAALSRAFAARGYRVTTARSPWRLGPGDEALLAALAEGTAGAGRETGAVDEASIADWLAARRSGAACTVGHLDLLALPA